MIPRPIQRKVPGELLKTKSDNHIEDLTKLDKLKLLEIKEREEKLLSKKSQLARLPDKGQRIIKFYEKVLKEITDRDEIENAARLFSELNIAVTGEEKLNNLEWTGNLNFEEESVLLDSDDEETDPLKIIAQSRNLKKQIKYIEPEKSLITEDDLIDIESIKKTDFSEDRIDNVVESKLVDLKFSTHMLKQKLVKSKLNGTLSSNQNDRASSNSSLNLDQHTLYLLEFKGADGLPKKERYLPHKTTINNSHEPEKEKHRKIGGKHWENTAATPPPIQHNGTKLLSLKDSVEIQADYLEKLKIMQQKHAEERMAARAAKLSAACDIILPDEQIRKVNKFFGSYRVHDLSSDESEIEQKFHSDEDVHDDEVEKGGFVNFRVAD